MGGVVGLVAGWAGGVGCWLGSKLAITLSLYVGGSLAVLLGFD